MIKKLILALSLIFVATSASAHPHVWVDSKMTMLTKDGTMTGFRVSWAFDEFYSTIFLAEADVNGNKILDADEIRASVSAVFEQEQKELYPFFFVKPGGNGKKFTLQNANVFMKEGKVYYVFDIVLDEPQPIKGKHFFGIYDPEFYVYFEQDVSIKLPEGVSCEQKLSENKNISIYYDMINPETYTLTCS